MKLVTGLSSFIESYYAADECINLKMKFKIKKLTKIIL